jgi:flagellar motor switch protein FliN/FliY
MPEPDEKTSQEMRDFLQYWVESLAQIVSQTGGASFTASYAKESPAELPTAAESDLHFRFTLGGGLRGEMNVRVAVPVAVAMGQLILQEPPQPDAELTADHRDGAKELMSQIGGHAATALKPGWGEVQVAVEAGTAPSWQPAGVGWIVPAEPTGPRIILEFQLSAALLAALRPRREAQPGAVAEAQPAPTTEQNRANPKLDLLMDVELDLTLRFGGRQMMLREILELSSGSVIQLDRQVNDPADLLLGDRLIARGEIVVVEGNYGLRVTELVSAIKAD